MHCIWQDKEHDMEAEDFVDEIKLTSEIIEKYKPDHILVDTRNLLIELTTDLQKITNDYIVDAYHKAGVKKVAMILPLQAIKKLYLEETVKLRQQIHKFVIENFTDEENARKWLFNE